MAADDLKQFIIINLDKDPYGVEIKYIESIIVMQSITRIPKAQSYFKGVINLRGDVVPVMSLRKRIGLDEVEDTPTSRIIILKPDNQGAPVGIIVDEVREVISLENSQIEKIVYDEKADKANYCNGIGKYENELISILNIPSIIGQEK
ncbi:MAG: purine-binding chemotaxis protein CheW [Clostridiales bacterium]|jgi:purine-binding chemotaxis protein CheW|nr:purine-binding chemotaxis protein CheW [Clostridiales bacterium]